MKRITGKKPGKTLCGFVTVQSWSVVELTEENVDEVLKTRFVFINFYKPW